MKPGYTVRFQFNETNVLSMHIKVSLTDLLPTLRFNKQLDRYHKMMMVSTLKLLNTSLQAD